MLSSEVENGLDCTLKNQNEIPLCENDKILDSFVL
jgi:hypothetical protein